MEVEAAVVKDVDVTLAVLDITDVDGLAEGVGEITSGNVILNSVTFI